MPQDGLPCSHGHCDVEHEQGLTGSALANQRDNLASIDDGGDDRLRGVGGWIHPIQWSQRVQGAFVGNGLQSSLKSCACCTRIAKVEGKAGCTAFCRPGVRQGWEG